MPLKTIIVLMYFLHFILYSYFNVLYVAGLPLRSLVIVLTGILVLVSDYRTVKSLGFVNYVYMTFATLGLIVSIINDVKLGVTLDGELKLFQSYLVILVSYYVLEKIGFKRLGIVILIITIPTAFTGILQGLGVEGAWKLNETLGLFQGSYIEQEGRAAGLSHYAIPQVSLLLSAIFINCYFILAVRSNIRVQYLLLMINLIFVLAIISSQTRSALAASLITISIIYFRSMDYKKLIPLGGIMIFMILIFSMLLGDTASVDSRLVSLEDQSAKDKWTLYKYSMELFIKQPYGYGFNFDTIKYSTTFFINQNHIFDYDVFEKAQYLVPVHNAMAQIAITYGLLGFLLLFIYLYQLSKFSWYQILFISSVLLNSSFHNMGILNGDLNIDMIFAIFIYEKNLKERIVNFENG